MSSALSVAKFAGAWVCLIVAVAFLVLGMPYSGLPMVLGVLSIAFSQAPANW